MDHDLIKKKLIQQFQKRPGLSSPSSSRSSKNANEDQNDLIRGASTSILHHHDDAAIAKDTHNSKKERKSRSVSVPGQRPPSIINASSSSAEVSAPFNIKHKVHVDPDYKWSGQNPEEVFELLDKLGEGAFGSVYKARHRDTHFTIAIKMVEIESMIMTKGDKGGGGSSLDELEKEISILKSCRSTNIVSYYGSCSNGPSQLWILMDYCASGSVRDLIETGDDALNEDELSVVALGALKGLAYLHAQHIVHRDVKAANILVAEDATVKIADFGVSAQLAPRMDTLRATLSEAGHDSHAPVTQGITGTPLWMAPEIIMEQDYDNKCDIWSLGITMIEMGDGRPPYSDIFPLRAMMMIPMKPPPTMKDTTKWSPELNDFVAKCLHKDPSQRPSAMQLLAHPFIAKALVKKSSEVLKKRMELYQQERRAEPKIIINPRHSSLPSSPRPRQPSSPLASYSTTPSSSSFSSLSSVSSYDTMIITDHDDDAGGDSNSVRDMDTMRIVTTKTGDNTGDANADDDGVPSFMALMSTMSPSPKAPSSSSSSSSSCPASPQNVRAARPPLPRPPPTPPLACISSRFTTVIQVVYFIK
eukprot:TRINITY_DN4190_c0_g1_i8.p1 TRINITY_DN4190_c0_g1~~TRINITY_DN4190_c0_g1_i8.p1  ORF type:complete len:587 (-),score=130.72 TRINITY_DN4190_c0_g1_i8:28-1788(-)